MRKHIRCEVDTAPNCLQDVDREYLGWQASADALAAAWTERGPFDGVLGFSQGAVMAHTLCWRGNWVRHNIMQYAGLGQQMRHLRG